MIPLSPPNEIPRNPSPKGRQHKIILLMAEQTGYDFWVEETESSDIFDLTVATFDDKLSMQRTEYVMTCHREALIDLKKQIESVLEA